MVVAAKRIVFFGLLIGLWIGLYAAGLWPPMLFPSPIDTWQSLVDGFSQGAFPAAIMAIATRGAKLEDIFRFWRDCLRILSQYNLRRASKG